MLNNILKSVLVLLSGCLFGIHSLKVFDINVTPNPIVGSDVILVCNYDTEHKELYSVMWYHNNKEFVRYMPKAQSPWLVHEIHEITVDLEKSDEKRLTITNIGINASGKYTCQVSAKPPDFTSDQVDTIIRVQHNNLEDGQSNKQYCPVDESQTSRLNKMANCKQDNEYLRPNLTHHFNYEITATGLASGTTTQHGGINIKCEGIVNGQGNCKYILKISKCTISELPPTWVVQNDKSQEFTAAISRYRVDFTMVKGVVGGLLAHKNEPLSILNFKRGIITTLLSRRKLSASDFKDEEMRTDVQGNCPVKYEQTGSTVQMVKDMNKCQFPSKEDWRYSPWSLFHNMSFIQTFWINSTANCIFKFNYGGNLQETSCKERHAIMLESTKDTEISVQTIISHQLKIHRTVPIQPKGYDTESYELKDIQYEYDKIRNPINNPENLTTMVFSLFDILTTNEDTPIPTENANKLDELIYLLRKSSNLTEIAEYFNKCKSDSSPSCKDENQKYTQKEIKFAQLWRDALVQCNRAECIRALRMLLEAKVSNLEEVITSDYVNFIFFSFMNVQIDELEIIEELMSILKARKPSRFLIFTFSSVINSFWTRQKQYFKNKVPTTLKNIVEYITKPITKDCTASEGHQVEDIAIALQAMSNIGNLLERVKPDYLNLLMTCVNNKEVHWSFSALAIKVTRRMNPSGNLYQFLLNILQNTDLKHEDHVLAYMTLFKKFESSKVYPEVIRLLNRTEESGLNYNLKSFILSHMRTVAKSTDIRQARYVQEILETMPNIEMTKDITNGSSYIQNCTDSTVINDTFSSSQYYIPEDEQIRVSKGYFSKYEEVDYSYGSSFLRDTLNRFGYGYSNSLLYTGTSYVPFASWTDGILYLFGKKIPVDSLFTNTRCFAEIIQDSGLEFDKNGMASILQGFGKDQCNFPNYVTSNTSIPLKFPYEVDKSILENLISIQNKMKTRNMKLKKANSDGLISFGFLDDILSSLTFQELLQQYKSFAPLDIKSSNLFNSNYWKIVEAFNLVPTLIGIPLNWTTDAFFIQNSMQNRSVNGNPMHMDMKTTNSFNGLAALRNGMNLDLPGFSNIGVQSYSTISTSLGANVDINWDLTKKSINLIIEPPTRPMQLLSLTRRNSLIKNHQAEDIPDWDVDRVTENWCSEKLVPILGMKLCHSKSYPNVTLKADKPWTLMAANSHWNYTTESVAKVHLQIAFQIFEEDENSQTFEVYINTQNSKEQNKPTELIKLVHKQKLGTGEFQTKLNTLFAQIKAFKENIANNGYHFKAESTFLQGPTTILDYQSKITFQKLSEETLKNHLSKTASGKWSSVPVTEVNLNITSPENFYGFNYKQHQFPTSFYTKHNFQYKSSSKKPWLWNLIESDIFREDSQSGWVELFQEVHHSIGSTSSNSASHQSYNYLKTPKSIIQLHTFQGPTKATVNTMYLNLTKHYLPSYDLMTYINFTASTEFHDENGLQSKINKISLVDPWYAITTELASRYAPGPPDNHFIKFTIRREALPDTKLLQHRIQAQDPHLGWMSQLHSSDDFKSSTSSVELILNVKDNELQQWESQIRFQPPFSNILLAAKKNVSASFIYHRTHNETPGFEIHFQSSKLYTLPYEAKHWRTFLLEIPSLDFRWNSKLNLDFSLEKEIVLLQSNMSRISTGQIGNYSLNVSLSKPDQKVHLSDELQSEIYNRAIHLVASYPTLFTPQLDLDMNITSYSPIESLLNVNLRQQVGGRKEVANMTHELVDIDVNGDWQNGYHKTFNFQSKINDIIPNLVVNIEYPDENKQTTFQLKFPDIPTELYIICQKNIKSTKLLFTFCLKRNCTLDDIETNHFIAEIELRLSSPQELTRTIIYNPEIMKQMEALLAQRVEQMQTAFMHLTSGPEHSTSVKIFLNGMRYTELTAVTIKDEFKDFFKYAGYVVTHDTLITAPTISIALNTVGYVFGPVITDSYFEWFWKYFQIEDKIIPWTTQIASRIVQEYIYRSGNIHGKSYISSTSLPIYLTSFVKPPKQLSPSFIRQIMKLSDSISQKSSPATWDLSSENYDRHALISKGGILHTFDGKISKDPSWMANDNCAYLLTHDLAQHKFTVYHKSGIQFLFPEIKLGLNYDGQLMVNERATDLPFQTSNGEIKVLRKGDIIQLKTTYNLTLVLNLKNRFMIFYTNKHKFGQLTGMFGNNNDNPSDDLKDPYQWELTNNPGCKSIYKADCHDKCNKYSSPATQWWSLMWRPDSPTLPCHDIVSLTEIAYKYKSCSTIPNDNINAYLALCSAKGVPVGSISTFTRECNVKKSWSAKIEGELEVIFLIDQTKRSPEHNILKGVETLVYTIQKHFLEEGYESILFGLVGFKGKGYRYGPQQHTMNRELLVSAKVFATNGLQTLEFNGPTDNNETASLIALSYAAEHYALSQKAVHVFVIVTSQDEENIASLPLVHDTMQSVALQSGTVYTIAGYPAAARSKGIYGIRGDGYVFPQPKTKDELFVDFPKGQLAKISSATRGAVWQLSYVEDINIPPKRYVQSFASEMVARAKQDSRQCRQCHCHINNAEQILNFCEFVACNNSTKKGQ